MENISDKDIQRAEQRSNELRAAGHAESARYDRRTGRIVLKLNIGMELRIPANLIEGLVGAESADLAEIEISPTGLGLYWPKLDIDLYVPALLQGVFGSPSWTPAEMGRRGGNAKTMAKSEASRFKREEGRTTKEEKSRLSARVPMFHNF